ncbi:MAG TPA: hypothetical protein VKP67_11545 [Xanthobacteraceae bacterium]|nr:hypothetical protein [Xanthobacteraceae bacterium]
MGELRDFVAEVLERRGGAVEAIEPDGLEVLAPKPMQDMFGWPELARLGFGSQRPESSIPIGLEGDWLDRFGALLGEDGRWSERQLIGGPAACGDPERILEHALDLPNAVWRLRCVMATFTRCLLLAFRYTALSDEKREGLVWLCFNLGTGAVIDDIAARLRRLLAQDTDWQAPDPEVRAAAGASWDEAALASRVRPLLDSRVKSELESFLRAMRRRLERDRNRVHGYHDDLRRISLKRIAGLAGADSEKAEADRRRESMRVAAIEREYRAKLDDLRHNYALRITVDWVQALELYMPVQRFDVLIKRRKGERLIRMDWHPLVRAIEPPLCEAGPGLGRTRFVCDDKLHLVAPDGQAPCPACGKSLCRACYAAACPRCRAALKGGDGAVN